MRHVDGAGVSGPRPGSGHRCGLGRDPRSEGSPPVLQHRRSQPFVAGRRARWGYASLAGLGNCDSPKPDVPKVHPLLDRAGG